MRRSNNHPIIGIILILSGVFFLFSKDGVNNLSWSLLLWLLPLVILGLGIFFHLVYFSRPYKNGEILVPGGMFVTSGILFAVCAYTGNWELMTTFWPIFPAGLAIGLLEYYLFGRGPGGVLIPVFIIGGIGIIFLGTTLNTLTKGYMVPVILILLGVFFTFRGNGRKYF